MLCCTHACLRCDGTRSLHPSQMTGSQKGLNRRSQCVTKTVIYPQKQLTGWHREWVGGEEERGYLVSIAKNHFPKFFLFSWSFISFVWDSCNHITNMCLSFHTSTSHLFCEFPWTTVWEMYYCWNCCHEQPTVTQKGPRRPSLLKPHSLSQARGWGLRSSRALLDNKSQEPAKSGFWSQSTVWDFNTLLKTSALERFHPR